jgi:hypothetical protein
LREREGVRKECGEFHAPSAIRRRYRSRFEPKHGQMDTTVVLRDDASGQYQARNRVRLVNLHALHQEDQSSSHPRATRIQGGGDEWPRYQRGDPWWLVESRTSIQHGPLFTTSNQIHKRKSTPFAHHAVSQRFPSNFTLMEIVPVSFVFFSHRTVGPYNLAVSPDHDRCDMVDFFSLPSSRELKLEFSKTTVVFQSSLGPHER